MSRRICVVNDYDGLYGRYWSQLGEVVRPYTAFLEDPKGFDLLCFTGGEDVSPELYGHRNLASGNSPERDTLERRYFGIAIENGIPMTGICRGAQFLNVMLGGTMVQHLKRSHGGGKHRVLAADGSDFLATSSHHQMIVPTPEGQVIAWAEEALLAGDCVYDGHLPEVVQDPEYPKEIRVTEAVLYPAVKVFAVQGHPEWQDIKELFPQWTLQQIRKYCFGEGQAYALAME